MSTLTITRGLPASGKTTWAKDWLRQAPDRARFNRDDLRQMMHGGFDRDLENRITQAQHLLIRQALRLGRDVVVDDTNLPLKTGKEFSRIAYEEGAKFDVVDHFLHTPLEDCISRDAARDPLARVGRRVIQGMHDRFFPMILSSRIPEYAPPAEEMAQLQIGKPYVVPLGAPKAVLVDLDGTMALMNGRGPHDYHRVGEDLPNKPIVDLVDMIGAYSELAYSQGDPEIEVIFMSGRVETCRKETLEWLGNLGWDHAKLFMRPALPDGVQQPKDSVVKLALFNEHIRNYYDVQFVLDDRDQVVEMWRSLGLTCLQVAPGAF